MLVTLVNVLYLFVCSNQVLLLRCGKFVDVVASHYFIHFVWLITLHGLQLLIELWYQRLTLTYVSSVIHTILQVTNGNLQHIRLNKLCSFPEAWSNNVIDNILEVFWCQYVIIHQQQVLLVAIHFANSIQSVFKRNVRNVFIFKSRYSAEGTMTDATTSHVAVESIWHWIFVLNFVKNGVIQWKIVYNLSVALVKNSRFAKNTNPRLYSGCLFKFLRLNGCKHTAYHQILFLLYK